MPRKEPPGRSRDRRRSERTDRRGPAGPRRGQRPRSAERRPGRPPREEAAEPDRERGTARERGPRADVDLLVGRNAVREALRAGRRRVYRLLIGEGTHEAGALAEIIALAETRGIEPQRVPKADLDRQADALTHQGVMAYASLYPYADLDAILALAQERGEEPLLLALDSVQDPQNVGSLLRTAEAVGVQGVIVPERRAAGISPAVSRASAGAVEHLLVAEVTNLVRTLEGLKERGMWVVGVEGVPEAQDYRTVDLAMPLALVVGGEGPGMRRLVREACDLLVRLPMRGQIESLNVSVAGSVVLYRAWEAREGEG